MRRTPRRGVARLLGILLASGLAFVGGLVTSRARDALAAERAPIRHAPLVVMAAPSLPPVLVTAAAPPRLTKAEAEVRRIRKLGEDARAGKPIRVSITQYCLRGITRRGNPVRPGILAADPRVFPLGRTVELFVGRRSLGRFLVDDTGGVVKGAIVDVWVPSCADAIQFGRRRGTVVMR